MREIIHNKKKWLAITSLLVITLMAVTGSVSAAEFPKDETIPSDQTINDDVFISGENVVIDGTINGNLFASGQKVTLNGKVTGDALFMAEYVIVSENAQVEGNLIIAGADLKVDGWVGGSVFGGSATMMFADNAVVEGNLYYGGFNLQTESGSRVGKDLYAGGYQTILSGTVDRDLGVAAAAIELDGTVGRSARLEVGQVENARESKDIMQFNPYLRRYISTVIQPGIRMGNNAAVGGDFTYISSIAQIENVDQAVSGSVIYQTPVPQDTKTYGGDIKAFRKTSPVSLLFRTSLLNIGRNFIKLMALGAIALWLFSKKFSKLVESAWVEPLKAMGWGFIIFAIGIFAVFVVPMAFVLIGILLGFLSLGSLLYVWFGITGTIVLLMFMLFFFAVFTISKIIAAYMFGKWILGNLFKMEKQNIWLNLLVGVFVFVFLNALPLVGWLVGFTASLIGTGAFWLTFSPKKA